MNQLTTKQAAENLGVSVRRVIALIESGRLPASRFGNAYSINEIDLELVRERKAGRPSKPKTETNQTQTAKKK